MKYKCLVADDSMLERDMLAMLLERTGMAEVIASCADGLEAYRTLADIPVDIVFTDIDMPNLNGLELVKSLKQQPVFVFISAHAQYAVDGYELDVADFILKPVQFERLLKALDKAKNFVELKRIETRSATASLPEADGDGFFIRTSDGLVQLHEADITHIQSAGNFSRIFTAQGDSFLTLVSMKNLELQLHSFSMVRVHRQYLINIRQINQIEPASVKVGNMHFVPLSNQYRQDLLDRLEGKILHRNPDSKQP